MLWPFDEEWDTDLRSGDPLDFPGYRETLGALSHESVRTGRVDHPDGAFVLIEGDFDVIGGSMGLVHGEKVVRALDRATADRHPVVIVTRSGGARMQEGMVSLIQMGRTAAAIGRHSAAGLLSVSVHRSPTTGGVFASYGSLTDLQIVEAGATIGFAGPRVVEQTGNETVEGRSHAAETAWAAGLVDQIAPPEELRDRVETALGYRNRPLEVAMPAPAPTIADDPTDDPADDPGDDPVWATVLAARSPQRPSGAQIAARLVDSWSEIRGGVDPTIRCGLARIGTRRAVVVATDRHAGDGRPGPTGFRKARRAVALAGRLGLPIVSLIDTPGADPRPDAENDAIAGEIARTFAAYADVPVPTIAVCVGEGGSGGALALAVSDRFLIQETAIFSVIGPEGAAAILERDAGRAAHVAPRLRLRSGDLMDLGIVDDIVPDDPAETARAVTASLDELTEATDHRLDRWDRATGTWIRCGTIAP